MGTSQSQSQKHPQGERKGHNVGPRDVTPHPPGKAAAPRGKPSPPSQPIVSDVTHSSVMLTWQPPRRKSCGTVFAYTIEMTTPSDPKAWTAVTKSCQGNTYRVKNLTSNSQYLFRVRAENTRGVSKGSRPSEVVETKMFDMEQPVCVLAPEDRVNSGSLHQPSITLHLENSVTSILNHTDIKVKTNTSKDSDPEGRSFLKNERREHRSLETLPSEDEVDSQGGRGRSSYLHRDGHTRSSLLSDRVRANSLQRDVHGRSSLQPDRWRSNSLQREANQRSSLQPSRKRSLPILLPGTRTDSLNKLRDSQTFPVTMKNRLNETPGLSRRQGQSGRERLGSDVGSTISETEEDTVDGKTGLSKDDSNADEDLKPPKRDSGLEEDADNPWEKEDSSSEASDGVLSAPLGEDRKVGMHHSHSLPRPPGSPYLGLAMPGRDGGQADFRMLRSLLHSDDIIVKSAHSVPDVGLMGRRASPYNTLTTIVDLEEEEDSVRITTL